MMLDHAPEDGLQVLPLAVTDRCHTTPDGVFPIGPVPAPSGRTTHTEEDIAGHCPFPGIGRELHRRGMVRRKFRRSVQQRKSRVRGNRVAVRRLAHDDVSHVS